MNAPTLKLHRAVLRQLKGVLSAYDEWITEEEAISATLHLKREREALLDKSRTQA